MKELIEKLQQELNLTADQAEKALETVKAYIVEKFPMIKGAVDNVFGGGDTAADDAAATTGGGSWMDKISDFIPGDLGEKVEGFAKKAVEEGSEAVDKATDFAKEMVEKGKQKLDDLT